MPRRRTRRTTHRKKTKKFGKIGAPHSAKRNVGWHTSDTRGKHS